MAAPATVGVIGTAVATMGSLQAHLTLHYLLRLEPSALGRVVTFDARRVGFGGFDFTGSPEPEERWRSSHPIRCDPTTSWSTCAVSTRRRSRPSPVRGGWSSTRSTELGAPDGRVVLACRSGQRALMAADRLRERGVTNLALVVALG